MPFNSLQYLVFLPATFAVFYLAGERFRWVFLLLASLGFYAALKAPYLLAALAAVTSVTYFSGIWIDRCANPARKRALFWCGVSLNLLFLASLKYLGFLMEILGKLSGQDSWIVSLGGRNALVFVGVSYYALQAVSYLIDIYIGFEKPEREFGLFALYLSFFPKLLQGPIERAGDLLPQLRKRYEFDYDNMRAGLLLFMWGLFKKVVVADRLAPFVDAIYGDVHAHTGLSLILATYFFAFQIYWDFSGYTDMALGAARIFNIKLTQNFNGPYLATSIADFWRRWHISFSRWILDYIFTPLQMKFRDWKNWGIALALIVTFLISGIWHGTHWGFVIWGLLHGAYLAASVFYKPLQKRIYKKTGLEKTMLQKIWQTVVTFQLVCFAWIFFRANSVSDALYVVTHLFSGIDAYQWTGKYFRTLNVGFQFHPEHIFVICSVLLTDIIHNRLDFMKFLLNGSMWLRWGVYYILVLSIIFFGEYNNMSFLYFKF